MDRNPGKLPIVREDWNGKVVGREGFSKSSVELKLHAGRFMQFIPERVENGAIFRAQIKIEEPRAVVPWPTASGDGCVRGWEPRVGGSIESGSIWWWHPEDIGLGLVSARAEGVWRGRAGVL